MTTLRNLDIRDKFSKSKAL